MSNIDRFGMVNSDPFSGPILVKGPMPAGTIGFINQNTNLEVNGVPVKVGDKIIFSKPNSKHAFICSSVGIKSKLHCANSNELSL